MAATDMDVMSTYVLYLLLLTRKVGTSLKEASVNQLTLADS